VLRNQRSHARLVAAFRSYEGRSARHRPSKTSAEIVEHHHALARINERINHMASDISSAARNQGGHLSVTL
jgi:hypothetical protein